jgi:tetratricopeptide (TPR) repeat protein
MATVLDLIDLEVEEVAPPVCGADLLSYYQSLLSSRRSGAPDFLSCAKAFESVGMNDKGIAACDEAIRRDDLFWQAYTFRAELLLSEFVVRDDLGSESSLGLRALNDYERALSLAGNSSIDLVIAFATALAVTGDYTRCVKFIESSLQQDLVHELKARSQLLYLLGFAFLFSGNDEHAILVFEEVVRLKVAAEDGVFGLAVSRLIMGGTQETAELERQLGPELSATVHDLQTQGCTGFLDVARAVALS